MFWRNRRIKTSSLMSTPPRDVVLFTRNHGAICYEKPLGDFKQDDPFAGFVDQIISSGLQWYWDSIRRHDTATDSPVQGLPQVRTITRLEPTTVATLHDDFAEVNCDGEYRFFDLYGLVPTATVDLQVEADFHRAIEAFASNGEGPLQIIIVQDGDSESALIYVPEVQDAELAVVMQTWGLTLDRVFKTCKYENLTAQTLEARFLQKRL